MTRYVLGLSLLLTLLGAAGLWVWRTEGRLQDGLYCLALGATLDRDVLLQSAQGERLAMDVMRPWWRRGRLPTVLIRTPYSKRDELRPAARAFAIHGFAVVMQDMRGRFGSGGRFLPYRNDTEDGVKALDWIAAQPWSNGKVGTYGCSALGESQLVLARARHPAHRAIAALGAGGGVGSAAGRYSYFGIYEGGVLELASSFGWFSRKASQGHFDGPRDLDQPMRFLSSLPVAGMVRRAVGEDTGFDLLVTTPLGDPKWEELGYLSDRDSYSTPGLHMNGWYDQTVSDALAAAQVMRAHATNEAARLQPVIIGPYAHCGDPGPDVGTIGDMEVRNARQVPGGAIVRWLRAWLDDAPELLKSFPPYQVFVLGENRWLSFDQWPPKEGRSLHWHLDSTHGAQSRAGDGRLLRAAPAGPLRSDAYVYNPMQPVPSVGGAACCTGLPGDRQGPVDQTVVETRPDVLIYTSQPLDQPLRLVGPIALNVNVSTSARDTDFVAKLVDVWPDGRTVNIQEGALRLRYRDSYAAPQLAEPGQRYRIKLPMRDIAYLVPAGHRLRLQVTSSSFPRLERNLNTGGINAQETHAVVATNQVFHGGGLDAYVELTVVDELAAATTASGGQGAH